MKGQSYFFNALQRCRYDLTASYNDGQASPYRTSYASSTLELTVNLIYEELCASLRRHFGVSEDSSSEPISKSSLQQYRNVVSTLNSFLASLGKTMQSRIGVELGSAFDTKLREYLDGLKLAGRTKRDRTHHMKLVWRLAKATQATMAGKAPPATLLSNALRAAIACTGHAPKTLAREIGVSPSALQRWLKGAQPNRRGFPTLRRLENALDLPRDHLVSLVREEQRPVPHVPHKIAYRQALRERILDTYVLTEGAILPPLLCQWHDFLDYKTAVVPAYKRAKNAKWRGVRLDSLGAISKLAQRGSVAYPTADIVLGRVRQFIGFLSLPRERGGRGLAPEEAQSLAWLTQPEAVNAFLQFMTDRSGGLKHGGHSTFCAFVSSLVRAKTGYLLQRPDLAKSLPSDYQPQDLLAWEQLCSQTFDLVSAWKSESRDVSRRPQEPIAHLLDLDEPLAPLYQAITSIEQEAAAASGGSLREALLMRDALLLEMLVWNPLRIRNWRVMTWKPDNMGNLYRAGDGWRIRLATHELKNGRGKDASDYDVPVPELLIPKLSAYIEEYRKTLLRGASSPYLFVGSRSSGIWNGIGRHVQKLTARYVPGSPGTGPHGFRHLIASDFLRRNPGSLKALAHLLNDKDETVIRVYAHANREDSFAQHEAHIAKLKQQIAR